MNVFFILSERFFYFSRKATIKDLSDKNDEQNYEHKQYGAVLEAKENPDNGLYKPKSGNSRIGKVEQKRYIRQKSRLRSELTSILIRTNASDNPSCRPTP